MNQQLKIILVANYWLMCIKMVKKKIVEELELPEGIKATQENNYVMIEGPKGVVKRKFDSPMVKLELEGRKIKLMADSPSKRVKAVVFAYKSHLKNAMNGCQKPFVYKLKICSGHFPMNVSVSGQKLIIKNFLGEKVPRQVKISEGASVKVDGSIINVEGADKELTGQVAADIEQATRRPGFDKRIFQDGIYIIEKAGKKI